MTQAADLRHIRAWVFDLDNTLYPPETQFMGLVEQKIAAYFERASGLSADAAFALQKRYLEDYGTSLAGLMRHHEVDAADFLADVHDVPLDVLAPDPGLRAGLERLAGPRLVFTNGATAHARRVLDRLEIADLVDGLFSIEDANLVPKPDASTFRAMLDRFGVDPTTACFFEDTERNLPPAKALGMTTALVGAHAAASTAPGIDYRAASLPPFLATARLMDAAA